MDELIPRENALKLGDPLGEATDVGQLIDSAAAERVSKPGWRRQSPGERKCWSAVSAR